MVRVNVCMIIIASNASGTQAQGMTVGSTTGLPEIYVQEQLSYFATITTGLRQILLDGNPTVARGTKGLNYAGALALNLSAALLINDPKVVAN